MTAPEVGLREAVETLSKLVDVGLASGITSGPTPRAWAEVSSRLHEMLATHPYPPLPGQPGVAEAVGRVLAAHVFDVVDNDCGGDEGPCGWTAKTPTTKPDSGMYAQHRAHVAAEVARALGGDV